MCVFPLYYFLLHGVYNNVFVTDLQKSFDLTITVEIFRTIRENKKVKWYEGRRMVTSPCSHLCVLLVHCVLFCIVLKITRRCLFVAHLLGQSWLSLCPNGMNHTQYNKNTHNNAGLSFHLHQSITAAPLNGFVGRVPRLHYSSIFLPLTILAAFLSACHSLFFHLPSYKIQESTNLIFTNRKIWPFCWWKNTSCDMCWIY